LGQDQAEENKKVALGKETAKRRGSGCQRVLRVGESWKKFRIAGKRKSVMNSAPRYITVHSLPFGEKPIQRDAGCKQQKKSNLVTSNIADTITRSSLQTRYGV